MECPKCHKTVGANDAVCKNCGLVLKDDGGKGKVPLFSPKKSSERKKERTELGFFSKSKGSLSAGGEAVSDTEESRAVAAAKEALELGITVVTEPSSDAVISRFALTLPDSDLIS